MIVDFCDSGVGLGFAICCKRIGLLLVFCVDGFGLGGVVVFVLICV